MNILKNKEFIGSMLFIFSTFILRAVSMITTPLYTRILTLEEYGTLNVYSSWSGILSIIFTLSIASNALSKGIMKYNKKKNDYILSMIVLTIILVSGGFILILIFNSTMYELSGLDLKYYVFLFVGLILNACVAFWSTDQKFENKYLRVVLFNTFSTICCVPLAYFCVIHFNGDRAFMKLLIESMGSYFCGIVVIIYYFIKSQKKHLTRFWKHTVFFCVPLLPHYLAMHLLNQSDRIMIEYYCGKEQTALYSIAYLASQILIVCWTAINGVFVPWLYRKLEEHQYSLVKQVCDIVNLLCFLFCIIVILFAKEYLLIVAPSSYYEAIYAIPPIMLGTFILIVCQIWTNILLFEINKTYLITIDTLISCMVNIILNVLLIPKFGYVAAAYTTLIGYFVMLITHYVNIRRLKLDYFINNSFIVLIILIGLILALLSEILYKYDVVRMALIIIISTFIFIKRKFIIELYKKMRGE